MKKVIYALIVGLLVVSGLVFANCAIKNEASKKTTPNPSAAEMKSEKEKWEATPAGISYKKWEAAPGGKKVLAAVAKISRQVNDSSDMEAVVTSLSLPPGSRLGFGVMIRINGEDYILNFGAENANELQQLYSLKVNDKIIIRSHFVGHAPRYAYPIVQGDYIERNHKVLYKRTPGKGGC